MKNQPQAFRAIKAYKSPYPEPIIFHIGEVVSVGEEYTEDPDWINWVWCEGEDGQEAWVPKQFLNIDGKKAIFNSEYNAMELSISIGDELFIFDVVNGFGMAENLNGKRGWVPMKCMEKVVPSKTSLR